MNRLLILDPDASLYRKLIAEQALPEIEVLAADNRSQPEPYLSGANLIDSNKGY